MQELHSHPGYERINKHIILNYYAKQLSDEIRLPLGIIRNFAVKLSQDDALRSMYGEYVDAILQGSQALQDAVLEHIGFVDAAAGQGEAPVEAARSAPFPG